MLASASLDHARILYVAADLSDVALVRNVLNLVATGLVLESCDTLEGALQKLQRPDAYDAILVDYRLQDGDGTTFVRHVRERALAHPALVLLRTRLAMTRNVCMPPSRRYVRVRALTETSQCC